ncbi:hypothetical protein [Psychrobacillus sp. OK032]|uniref:hypothetical protein n=1 Tax=Psychrobacillus sp. OK032 TaxID=1884358 RepID=UPI0015A4F083|nr:hypothetical protein [Psychrobacillus sp. OK032]
MSSSIEEEAFLYSPLIGGEELIIGSPYAVYVDVSFIELLSFLLEIIWLFRGFCVLFCNCR